MKLMTKNKAMELLGIGRTALENMLKAGQLKCVPVGNTYRIPDFRFCAEIVQKSEKMCIFLFTSHQKCHIIQI